MARDFDEGNIHYKGHWKGRARGPENLDFLGTDMEPAKRVFFYMVLGLNGFDAGKSITRFIRTSGLWKSRIFWAQI